MSNNSRLSKEEIAKIRESYETASESSKPVMDSARCGRQDSTAQPPKDLRFNP